MPCGGCGYSKKLPYDPKREMRNRRSYRRRMRNAVHKKDENVLSKERISRSESMGKGNGK
jgi:hypothetical protein